MASPLPLRPAVDHTPHAETVIDITEEESNVVFKALGSETARSIFAALNESPATASDLAARNETSLQNVQYHLERLAGANLIEPVDTWYSSKGREMTVYAVNTEQLVLRCDGDLTDPSHQSAPAAD